MTDESPRTWAEVVSTDYVWSVKKGSWFEVIEVWAKGGRVHFRLRGADKAQDLPATTPVKVRRSEMGAAVDRVTSIMSSGPNGFRDAGTDQASPFYSRVRQILNLKVMPDRRDFSEVPSGCWAEAKAIVLAELHDQATEEDGKR